MNVTSKIRLTIGTKLVGLIAVLLMGSIVSIVWLSTRMFIEDNTALIQQMNADTAASLGTRMRELLVNVTEKVRVLGSIELQEFAQPEAKDRIVQEFFSKDKDFLAVVVYKHQDGAAPAALARAISPDMAALSDGDGEKTVAAVMADKDFSLARVERGEVLISSTKLPDGSPAIALALPFIAADKPQAAPAVPGGQPPAAKAADAGGAAFSHTLLALIRQSKFLKVVSDSDIVTSYMVDSKGRLMAHPDAARVAAGENVSHLGVVRQMLEGKFNNGQTRYLDPQSGEARLGAYHLVGLGGLGVVAEVAEAKAFEAARRVQIRSMWIALIVLCLSFMVGYFYSGTITWPIKQLVKAAKAIAEGDFKINLKPKSRDEIAALSLAFNDMAKGLEERDKVKETFNKFHNKEIAEKLLSGEVKLGGERKEATIFFSDVRGFTAMSETMEPEQVVEMLNEYMTRMVAIVRKHHGIVDKYVGDAIMAIWGVPIPGPDDTLNAVRACLEMRQELASLNELRLSRGQSALKIGMGLNTGPVIAGNIGSVEKMEYTVIGDSVNLASRMESMTKEYGTDLLIPLSIREKVEGRFVFEKCKSAKVKGKTQAIEIFKVKGYVDESGNEVIVETPYSSYESEKSDKVVHDEPAHEEHAPEPAPEEHAESVAAAPEPIPAPAPEPVAEAAPAPEAAATAPLPLETPGQEAGQYFLDLFGDVLGPFTAGEIRIGVAERDFTPDMKISPRPEGPWRSISEEPGLIAPAPEVAQEPAVVPPAQAPVAEQTPAQAPAQAEPARSVPIFAPPPRPAGLKPRSAGAPTQAPAPEAPAAAAPSPLETVAAAPPASPAESEPPEAAPAEPESPITAALQIPPESAAPAPKSRPEPLRVVPPAAEPETVEIQPLEVIIVERKKRAA